MRETASYLRPKIGCGRAQPVRPPCLEIALVVSDDARAEPREPWAIAGHPEFGQVVGTDAETLGRFDGGEGFGGHACSQVIGFLRGAAGCSVVRGDRCDPSREP